MKSALLAASIVVACGCSSGGGSDGPHACTLIGCEDGATFETTLPSTIALAHANVTVCRDDRCANGIMTADGTSLALPDGTSVYLEYDGRKLTIRFVASFGVVADGDTYYARFDDPKTGAPIYTIDSGPVTYAVSQPNGPGCDPICHQATIPPSAAR